MEELKPIISAGNLTCESLAGQVAVVTGGGDGIGFEAGRALAWLGASVIIAEINKQTGRTAAQRICEEMGEGTAVFIQTDVGDERSVASMAKLVDKAFGKVDIVLNNATIAPLGAVTERSIKDWDTSYRVNLRGPVLLAQAFIPGMKQRGYGVFVCVSSTGDKYMGAYESFKAAQVHLATTLDGELEESGVIAFTIGPGLVPDTPGASAGIKLAAPLYGVSTEEFAQLSKEHILSVEAAGAGFAAAITLAQKFQGQEIGSRQALIAAGINLGEGQPAVEVQIPTEQVQGTLELCRSVRKTLKEQIDGWLQRPVFERQWVKGDFRKNTGLPAEEWLDMMERLEKSLASGDMSRAISLHVPLGKLAAYYTHLDQVMKGFEKDPVKIDEYSRLVIGWEQEAATLENLLK